MAKKTCPQCNSFIVSKANYCWNCGFNLVSEYVSHSPSIAIAGGSSITQPIRTTLKLDWKSILVTKLFPPTVVGIAVYIVSSDHQLAFSLSALTAVLQAIAPGLNQGAIDWYNAQTARIKAKATKNIKTSKPKMIQIEHLDQYGRPRFLNEFDERVSVEDLAWVHHRTAEHGARFSKRGVCVSGGVVSEKKLKILQNEFLRLGYARKLYPKTDNSPIVLEPQGIRMLRWAALDIGLDYFV